MDVDSRRLVGVTSRLSVHGVLSFATVTGLGDFVSFCVHDKILSDFSAITTPHMGESSLKHTITYHIVTKGAPFFARARRRSHYAICRQVFEHMPVLGIIGPSFCNSASALNKVPRKHPGECRLSGDYRALNAITVWDQYLLLHLQNFPALWQAERYSASWTRSTPITRYLCSQETF